MKKTIVKIGFNHGTNYLKPGTVVSDEIAKEYPANVKVIVTGALEAKVESKPEEKKEEAKKVAEEPAKKANTKTKK